MTATAAPTTIVTTFTTSAPTPVEAEAAAILADYRLARDAEVAAKAAKQAAQDRGNLLLQSLGVSEYSYKGRTIRRITPNISDGMDWELAEKKAPKRAALVRAFLKRYTRTRPAKSYIKIG